MAKKEKQQAQPATVKEEPQYRVWLCKHPALGAVELALPPDSMALHAAEAFVQMTGLKSRVPVEVEDKGLVKESEVDAS